MQQLFYHLYTFIHKRKIFVLAAGLVFVGLLGYFASKISFEEDITKLIPSNEQSETLKKVLDNVHFSDKIVVNISSESAGNEEELVAYANAFLDSIEANAGQYISKIQGKVETKGMLGTYDFVAEHLPLFLDAEDYAVIGQRLNKDSISNRVEAGYKTLLSPTGLIAKKYIVKDPLQMTGLGLEKLKQLQVGSNFELYQNFLVTKDGKNLLLFLTPTLPTNETDQNTVFINILNNTVENLNKNFSQAEASLFGATLYAVANAKQIKQDIQLTVTIALGILLLILLAFYRNIFVPIILFVPTLVGGLTALAFLYFLKGEISAISLGIGSILLGITLDYSLHILTHFRNSESVQQLFEDVSVPVLMSGFTTATAFVCLLFVQSEALKDLGIFAAISVVGAAIIALVVIPQLYKIKPEKKQIKQTVIDKIAGYDFHKNKVLLLLLCVIFAAGVFFFNDVKFNNDLSDLNYQPKELVEAEKALMAITDRGAKSIYMVSHGSSMNEALNANNLLFEKLKKQEVSSEIMEFSSIGGIVLSTAAQMEKINQWNTFWTKEKKEKLHARLTAEGLRMGYTEDAFDPFFKLLQKDFTPIVFSDYEQVSTLFMDEFVSSDEEIATVVSVVKIAPEKATDFIAQFDGNERILAIDRKKMNESFLGSLKNDFNTLIGYSTFAVFLILLFSYRNLELSVLTFSPIVITWVIVLAIMDILNIHFNIFNVMIATFIFGLGVDYSIFMTKGLRKKHEFGGGELTTFRTSIILSVITTLLGIGALIFAKHPALKSIALVSILGIVSTALVSFVLQPFLFQVFIINRAKRGLSPLRIRQTLHSSLSFLYFGLGAFLLSTFSVLLIPVIPIKKSKKMLFFHQLLSKFMKSVLYSNSFVKKRIINLHKEDFSKQCIIIANHTSFLDILALGMLHPKLIYLVNDWVYDSPIFGKAVKMAGFYPVSNGIDDGVDHLKEKVRQGYSIIAFPEGSRSKTQKIRRFHKGAFHLSRKLQLDILPVLIHGNAHVLPKGDFIIHDGEITVNILKRIPPSTENSPLANSKMTKAVSNLFKSEFQKLQTEIETENYYKKKLLDNYRYKTCFQDIKKEFDMRKTSFLKAADYLKAKDRVLELGSEKGMLGYYLCYKKPQLKIVGIEENKEELAISKHCYSAFRENIAFKENIDLEDSAFNVLLISGKTVFSYLNREDYFKLQVERILIMENDFNYQGFIDTGFEIIHKKPELVVLKRRSDAGK